MKKLQKWIAVLGTLAMLLTLAGCGKPRDETSDTLVVGTLNFDGKFSPFFYTNSYENEVLQLVHVRLLETDREGAVVYRGIEGEVRPYNGRDYTYRGIADCTVTENGDGTVFYDFRLRPGVRFSDGTVVDADDVIFSMYVALDPGYDGIMTLYSLPIQGLEDYRTGAAGSISGIQKTGSDSLRVVLTELSATAIYTPMQAYLAAKAGAEYAAPYVNRIDNLGGDGVATTKRIHDIYVRNNMPTRILAAGFKNSQQVQELCEYGISCLTIASDVIENLIRNANVTAAVQDFVADFESLCGKGKTMMNCEE